MAFESRLSRVEGRALVDQLGCAGFGAIVARLKAGAHERAAKLLEQGPPFDPHDRGLRRHAVYLSSDEVVFFFGGREVDSIVDDLVSGFPAGEIVRAFERWRPLVEGHPRLAREMYFWEEGVKPRS